MGYDVIVEVKKYNKWHDPATGRFTSGPSGGGMTTAEVAGSDALKEYNYIGLRTLTPDENYKIGDTARESYDWDFEEDRSTYETDGSTLGGTAAINIVRDPDWDGPKEVEAAINQAMDASDIYEGDRKVIIGGKRQRYGDDPSETIIENAEVLAIYDSTTGKWDVKKSLFSCYDLLQEIG